MNGNNLTPSVSRATSPQPSSINVISPADGKSSVMHEATNTLYTRRSQFKKQTPSTIISSCSNHDMNDSADGLNNDGLSQNQNIGCKNCK